MAMYERYLLFDSPILQLSPRTKLCTIRYILGRGHFRYTSRRTRQRPRQGPRLMHVFYFATPLLFTLHPSCKVSEAQAAQFSHHMYDSAGQFSRNLCIKPSRIPPAEIST